MTQVVFELSTTKASLRGVLSVKKVDSGNLALPVLATQSGGMVLNSRNDFQKLVMTPLADAQAFYTMSFDAPPADHPDQYHALQVKLDKPGLTAPYPDWLLCAAQYGWGTIGNPVDN